ncbi:hypothetical protein [Nocardioides plantarum]|uniref:Uncharacterized protein n=1 Tax=Nocardioides plantarum TaxID=29299 RepID=A0ABV5KGE9_9ACTN|nr:hypothetical protein [Nocardioides plantarum]
MSLVLASIRTRSPLKMGTWVTLVAFLSIASGERAYLFRASEGLEPRPVSVIELVVTLGACCIPAVGHPQMWSWERVHSRPGVRMVAASWVPGCIVLVGLLPTFLRAARPGLDASVPTTALCNVLIFGSVAAVVTVFVSRRAGSSAAIAGYVVGVAVQALDVALPVPVRTTDEGTWAVVVACAAVMTAAALMMVTLGRTPGSDDA